MTHRQDLHKRIRIPGGSCFQGIQNIDSVRFRTDDSDLFRDRIAIASRFESLAVKPFLMSIAPVTVSEFAEWLQTANASTFFQRSRARYAYWNSVVEALSESGRDVPVAGLHFEEAMAYCQHVGGRLPTSAEWYRAARADSAEDGPSDLEGIHWASSPAGGRETLEFVRVTRSTARTNDFGLIDMLGNVAELTSSRIRIQGKYRRVVMEVGVNAPLLTYGSMNFYMPDRYDDDCLTAPHHGLRVAYDIE